MNNVNYLLYLEIIEMGKMESGRALKKSLFIHNGRGYKAKLEKRQNLTFLLIRAPLRKKLFLGPCT